ncbi:hypothetical protein BN381_10039 [Candidatus Microthrix parvicella RN1]|uniref:Uncharacterized protein n=1 Tax=Candidatus Neomicrothrix parvicella RN1 TaxID=1229780 RepID=R4YVM9_9ACTN|nr:hypothetical protein BN381_10039 [Candidatus Microthrix parvicella RN1]
MGEAALDVTWVDTETNSQSRRRRAWGGRDATEEGNDASHGGGNGTEVCSGTARTAL